MCYSLIIKFNIKFIIRFHNRNNELFKNIIDTCKYLEIDLFQINKNKINNNIIEFLLLFGLNPILINNSLNP